MTYSLYFSDLTAARQIVDPPHLVSFGDLQEGRVHPPKSAGLYAWWFSALPPNLPKDRLRKRNGRWLLYVGIGPQRPSAFGKVSKSHLAKRLRNHWRPHCSRSTLRFSLAALLAGEIGLEGFTNSAGKVELEGDGENRLSKWMSEHAFVCWAEHGEPWRIEEGLIAGASLGEPRLPLNIDGSSDPFRLELKAKRFDLKRGPSAS